MKKPLIIGLVILSAGNLLAVISGGFLSFTPVPGAISYTLWKAPPGQQPQYVSSVTSPYLVQGPIADGTTFYLRSTALMASGQCCAESDYGYVVMPPVTLGTNILRFSGPVDALILQSSAGLMTWTNVAIFTGSVIQLDIRRQQFLRTIKTNLPPMPPQ